MLEPNRSVEKEMAAGQEHVYQIALAEGDFLRVVVEQRGIDVVVKVFGPDGKQISENDSAIITGETETISQVAPMAGAYRLIIQPVLNRASAGRYEIKAVDLRPATASEHRLQQARDLGRESFRLYRAGRYDEARPLSQRALEMRRMELAPDNVELAYALNNLGIIQRAMGEYAKAEPLYREALSIREKALGPEHPLVAQSLHNLANLYDDRGLSAKAEPLYQRGLEISEKSLGPDHPQIATSLNSLAILARDKGDYLKAEQLYQRSLDIREKALGPEHPFVGTSLNNLAALYDDKGDYAKAEQLYGRSLAIREKSQGPEHPDVATSLDNLGLLYSVQGEYTKAEPLYQRALAIREKALGREHPRVAQSLSSLALLNQAKGDYATAESLLLRALAIQQKASGPEHSDVAEHLSSLADLYRAQGDYAKAEPPYQRALEIREKMWGPEHPRVAESLGALSALYTAKGEVTQAIAFQSRSIGISERNIAYNLASGSERQKLAYLATLSAGANRSISLHVRYAPDDPAAIDLAFSTILQRKGRILDAMSGGYAARRQHSSSQDRAMLEQLNDINAQLANLVIGGPKQATLAEHQKQILALEEQREALEATISGQSVEFRSVSQPITVATIQTTIPANAALVEFASYQPFNAKAVGNDQEYGEPHYVAYVLRREGVVSWKEIGDAKTIDTAIRAFRTALSDPKRRDLKVLARALDEKIMQPLRGLIGEATHVIVSPDGALNLIPFEALADQQDRYLIERYSFTYVTSGRDLLRLQSERVSRGAPLVVADPLYGEPEMVQVAGVNGTTQKSETRRGLRQSVTTGADLSNVYFAPLSGTALEAKQIKSLLPDARVLLGKEATEASLKQAEAPRILHIATHGFFLEDKRIRMEGTRGVMRGSENEQGPGAKAKIENPLLRSGLALAGANLHKDANEDGILTALEASGLNLWGTKLVVLSACETGVGVVSTGEGLYGLRRSLVLAGSESQVMSLWQVSDYVTRRLMKAYYAGLKQGLGRGEALRRVKLDMLRQRGMEHPFYWASFIQSGKWTGLYDK